jgi:hypothetical protein
MIFYYIMILIWIGNILYSIFTKGDMRLKTIAVLGSLFIIFDCILKII